MTADPIRLLDQRRADLIRLDMQLAAQEEGVQRRRAELQAELTKLDIAVDVLTRVLENESAGDAEVSAGTEPASGGMKIADAAEKVLQQLGGQGKTAHVLRILQDAGRIASSRGAYSTLVKTMARQPDRFEKVETGVWRLVQPAPTETKGSEERTRIPIES